MASNFDIKPSSPKNLMEHVLDGEQNSLNEASESAWIEVIQKMDEAYADLIESQVELEHKNAELEEAHYFMQSIQASMSDVLIVTDIQGRIIQVNKALAAITRHEKKYFLGEMIHQLLAEENKGILKGYPDGIRNKNIIDLEITIKGRDEQIPLSVNGTARLGPVGKFLGMVLIGRPIGELKKAYKELNEAHLEIKQAQEQLIQSEKMASLGRVVAGVAHELNNPISFVYSNVFALKDYSYKINKYLTAINYDITLNQLKELHQTLDIEFLSSDLKPLIEGTLEGAERVRDIVLELRQFSSGKQEENIEFDLVHVIKTAAQWVGKESKKHYNLIDELPEQILIEGHPGQIQQVMMNLFQNAIDSFEKKSGNFIEIKSSKKKKQHVITIRDNGPGIPDKIQNLIFEPFFTTKPVGEGTGLGLSISFGIISKLGGTLKVSNHKKGGACFKIYLPGKLNKKSGE